MKLRLHEKLHIARRRAGLTTQQVAGKLGITRAIITSIELGRYNVSKNRLQILANIYRMDVKEFIDDNS